MKKLLHLFLLINLPLSLFSQNLVSVSPNTADAGQTLNVTITGNNTHFDQGSSTSINFSFNQGSGTTIVNSLSVVSATSISANITVPSSTYTGDYELSTYCETDGILSLPNAFHVNGITPPSVVSVTPNTANAGQTLNVTITGNATHFTQGSGTILQFGFDQGSGTTIVNSITAISETSLNANVTIPYNVNTGDYDVILYNDVDGVVLLSNGFHVNGLSVITGYVVPTSVSQEGVCDGSATAIVFGGFPPYIYLYSNGGNTSSSDNFCEGLQSLTISDSTGNLTVIDFIIPSPLNSTSTDNYIDSAIVDSLYNNALINCDLDYNNVDAAYIVNFSNLPNDSIVVTWNIVSGNSTVTITDVYGLGTISGVYQIILEVYCPNKAIGDFLYASDQIYYTGNFIGIEEISEQDMSVYPNPFSDVIFIALENDQPSEVVISDVSGKTVYQTSSSQKTIQVDLSALLSGTYIVQVKNDSSVLTRKIIK